MAHEYILVVDDEPDIRSLLKDILEDEGYQVETASNAEMACTVRRARRPDAVLLDIWMPDRDGITLLKEWTEESDFNTPVIMMSGHGTVETAVEATRLGACDFIEKPISLARLLLTVQQALQTSTLLHENSSLLSRLHPANEPVGHGNAIRKVREHIKQVAPHELPTLFYGEAGAGKSVFAGYLHHHSTRKDGPFIAANVASLFGDNTEKSLFGSEEGGNVCPGLLDQANGGTLFLEDIGDLAPTLQMHLLGALKSRCYLRVGGTDPVSLDARILTATRYDLEHLVSDNRFRQELYYQLNVVAIHIPPLRERAEDVPDLLHYYVNYFFTVAKLPYRHLTVAAQNYLRQYRWPGNVYELKNLVQRLLIVGGGDVDRSEVEQVLESSTKQGGQFPAPGELFLDMSLRQARKAFERYYFEQLLLRFDGNIREVARQAEVERTHLYRKLRSLGIDPRQLLQLPE